MKYHLSNLWLEGYISLGDIRVAEDVINGGVNTLNSEGRTHWEYQQPGGCPGLCLGFSSISKSCDKRFLVCLIKYYCTVNRYLLCLPSIEVFSPKSLQTLRITLNLDISKFSFRGECPQWFQLYPLLLEYLQYVMYTVSNGLIMYWYYIL